MEVFLNHDFQRQMMEYMRQEAQPAPAATAASPEAIAAPHEGVLAI